MGEWKRWAPPAVAAIGLVIGLLVLDWVIADLGIGTHHLAPRSSEACLGPRCIDIPSGAKTWNLLSTLALGAGVLGAIGLGFVTVMRFLGVDPGPIGKAVAFLCAATAALSVIALIAVAPDSLGDYSAGGPVTIIAAIAGVITSGAPIARGAFDGGRSAIPIRSTARVAAPPASGSGAAVGASVGAGSGAAAGASAGAGGATSSTPAGASGRQRRPSAYDMAHAAPAAPVAPAPLSRTARPNPVGPAAVDASRDALRFVVVTGSITDDGLELRLERNQERTVRWDAIVEVAARRLPPDPPYDKTGFVDLVVAGEPPVRLLPSSRLDYAAMPGGMAPNTRENWRRLVALARERNPAITVEADSADFFAGGRDAPMFPAIKLFLEWDARYDA